MEMLEWSMKRWMLSPWKGRAEEEEEDEEEEEEEGWGWGEIDWMDARINFSAVKTASFSFPSM